ncbi:kinase-like domain-containing protein [Rhizophagus diaphanus]|nr:kinase-like domain-containing protein [Rhizophagus diaphanus] [Rhizophagus sp. MUCL 43196]
MELVNVNDNSFDPTPKLKSSPIPILFVSFNEKDDNCFHCGEKYVEVLFCRKKYCKKCFSHYITYIDDINIYLDVYFTMSEHETSNLKKSQNIQEYCRNFLDILCFKQIPTGLSGFLIDYDFDFYYGSSNNKLYINLIESVNYCKLCKKSLYQGTDTVVMHSFKLCSDCYLISFEWIESTLTKDPIPITYLPWWDNTYRCGVCSSKLKITSECQKYCTMCLIVYTGCRYCLTTTIIFGLTNQSKCKKCNRVSSIILDITCINTGNSYLDDFILSLRLDISNNLKIAEFTNSITNFNKYFLPITIYIPVQKLDEIFKNRHLEWIPYSQFANVKEIAEGGFSIIYQATWLGGKIVILKRFKNSKNISKYFLNELKSNYHCSHPSIIETYGFTKDPELDDYMLVMEYALGGDLHNYLQRKFTDIKWIKKLDILRQISKGLWDIHKTNFIHRDFHSGNILCGNEWKIGDLGLSQAINSKSSNNEIYGVIPYIAPEIFKGSAFSKESDIYSMGMIMWEFTTGCKPFTNFEHDIHLIYKIIDGLRPKITEDTPECYACLMKSCWDPNPQKRPSIVEIYQTFEDWRNDSVNRVQFHLAEIKRVELMNSKKLGPKFTEKHSKAIYTSRSLSVYISKISSINLSINSFDNKQDYVSKDQELDIDIDIESNSSSEFINSSRNELNIKTFDSNNGKRVKI